MLRSGTLTSVITSGLFVYIWSIRVADVCVILVGDFTSWVKPSSVIVESQEECGFSKSILKSPSTRISAWGLTQRERERETERERQRQTDRDTDRQTDKQTRP